MDAKSISILERSVECNICQDPVEDPRTLPCHHTYCRSCIDDLLKFNENGAATVKCPNNCNGETLIKQDETTKILPKNFALSNVLDLIKESKQSQSDNNSKSKNTVCLCKSCISKWCIGCKVMFCNGCYQKHDCKDKSSVTGNYNLIDEKFQPCCEEHDAYIKYVCLDCGHRFICSYCRHRDHRSHKVDTLEQTAKKYKQKYFDDLDKINGDHLDFSYDDVITNIFEFEGDLALELNARMLLKVSTYIKKLNKEKNEILSQYKQAANKYKQSVNDLQLTHKTFKENLDSTKKYLSELTTFETLALQNELNHRQECLTKLNAFRVTLLKGPDCSSLGILKTEQIDKQLVEGCEGFIHDVNMEKKNRYAELLMECNSDMNGLQKSSKKLFISNNEEQRLRKYSIKDIDDLIFNNDVHSLTKIIFIKQKQISDNLSHFIKSMIDNNQSNVLNLLLKSYPDAVNMKRDDNIAPLLYAVARGNAECINTLLQNNANIHVRDESNSNYACLHLAAYYGYHEIITILLNHGAEINSKGNNGETPLMIAAIIDRIECVNILLQNNAKLNLKSRSKMTYLDYAIEDLLRKYGAK